MQRTRKRYSKGKRVDMRNGGRVRAWHGVKPERNWFDSNEEYRIALQEWNQYHTDNPQGGGSGGSSENPFPDTGDIPYADTTVEQAGTAREQIEDAAQGIVPEEAKIPAPAKLEGKWDFSKDWQEGGNIGTHLKTGGGQTGQELIKALYAAGREGKPEDWITIGGKKYGWDDYHNIINKEKGMHDTIKTDSIYEADATLMGDEPGDAAAATVGDVKEEDVTEGEIDEVA